jgi:phosphatidylglycerol:prolipoprotein diacylglycerol transferase
MHPKLISIGSFFLPSYGVLVTTGFLVGLWLTGRLARRRGVDAQSIIDLALYCALAGIAGAKLLIFILEFDYFRLHPEEIFSLSTLRAGGVFSGGLLAALAVAAWFMRRHRMALLTTLDIAAPGLAIGHAIGRIGCFAAGCCYGTHCDQPWAVVFKNQFAHEMFQTPIYVPLHPTQLYEALAEALICAFLLFQFPRSRGNGWIFGWWMLLYGIARVWIEFYRVHEQAPVGPLTATQWIGVGLAAAGGWLIHRAASRKQPAAPQA